MKYARKMSHLLSVLGVLLMVGALFGGYAKLVVTLPNDGADAKPWDGSNRYVLHFNKGETPPTNATWSVSMCDPDGFYVPNAINRYNLAPWMPLKYIPDGSLDLYIQASSPGADKDADWLPSPASGPLNLTVCDYWPKEAVLDGSYKLPPVRKVM